MNSYRKAKTLREVAAQTNLEPLQSGDPRYVDISQGRRATDLQQLRVVLEDGDAQQNCFVKAAFTGHRGSGKSTELLRMEHDLSDRFTCLHLYVDETLLGDCDYTDLFLWMVDALVRRFQEDKLPLDKKLVEDVLGWFAETTLEDVETVKSQITAEAEAETQVKTGLYWFSLKLMARVKSAIVGSSEHRTIIRRKLQSYSSDLISRVNLLLDNAQSALEKKGKRPDLLIVQDNLDRLRVDAARRLFCDNGDLLKSLHAHVVYTVPIPMILAPHNIGNVFEHFFIMPVVKVRTSGNRKDELGIAALISLIAERIDIEAVFAGSGAERFLAEMSGGSVRDLIRLVNYAQLAARVAKKEHIDKDSARQAVTKLRLDFERLLIPPQAYFPLLARIHLNKALSLAPGRSPDPDRVEKDQEFFSHLLINGTVLEYNGERTWYDVHPAVRQIEAFKDALKKAKTESQTSAG